MDASYQVSVHLAEGFQRRRLKCEKLTDDGQRTPSDGKSSRCLWQGELKRDKVKNKIYHTVKASPKSNPKKIKKTNSYKNILMYN